MRAPLGADNEEPLLTLSDISISFRGLRALQGISTDVRQGEIVGLIGPNGAGKTTLFNIITRLYDPDTGSATFAGQDLLRFRPHEVADRGIARTFQTLLLFNEMSVLDNVMVGLHARMKAGTLACALRTPSAQEEERTMRQRALEVLDIVGLRYVASRPARTLPPGHQHLLQLARAVAPRPRLLLLDEPGAGMAAEELAALAHVLRTLHEREQLTLLLIGHTMRLVLGISHRVVVLDHGVKLAEGTPAEIRENDDVVQAYLGRAERLASP